MIQLQIQQIEILLLFLQILIILQRNLEMSRHSVQIKALLQSKRLSRSRFNPQMSMKLIPQTTSQIKTLKRSQSSSSLMKKKGNCQMLLIEQRYRKLQHNYRAILQQTRSKAILFSKQKQELEKYKLQGEKDKKQIERLRSMLGFIKKQDFGVQVDRNVQSRTSVDKDYSKTSMYSKGQKSTDAGLRQTGQNWNSKQQRKRSSQKQSRVKTPYKLLNNKSQTTICFRSPLKQSNIKSTLLKYKFVPTLTFNY